MVSATTTIGDHEHLNVLWFAWKFVPLWYQQQHWPVSRRLPLCCDLLENLYLCGISNNSITLGANSLYVVICLKICTFVVSATTIDLEGAFNALLWFAWKFVPLWYQQQPTIVRLRYTTCCDLLENLYLCGISNNFEIKEGSEHLVVICLKICTFVVSATTKG